MKIDSVYAPLQYLCSSLSYCVYLLANNSEILHYSREGDPDDGNYDSVVISQRNSAQFRDILLNQRDRLIKLINQNLQDIGKASIQITADIEIMRFVYLVYYIINGLVENINVCCIIKASKKKRF